MNDDSQISLILSQWTNSELFGYAVIFGVPVAAGLVVVVFLAIRRMFNRYRQ